MAKNKKSKSRSKPKNPAAEPEVKVSSESEKKKSSNPVEFLKEVQREGSKVSWTSRNETMISTVMVLVMVVIMSLFFLLVDQVWRTIIPFILSLG
ncbi:preprotein translocase subunit SecE [Parvularcula sp. IMCC14364]|uniref:preprotein translocase subunit SecE n=1 Tax=Parvularcula sp. IMCC14364 TaxID=3067902 RepID=UPI002740CEB5|nr:preprotein translocase subunit SecE [Parvularcula sp. IMCC14364]